MSMVYQNRTETIEVSGRYTIALNDGMGYLAAGLASHGIMQLPTFMARVPIADGRLVPLLLWRYAAPVLAALVLLDLVVFAILNRTIGACYGAFAWFGAC